MAVIRSYNQPTVENRPIPSVYQTAGEVQVPVTGLIQARDTQQAGAALGQAAQNLEAARVRLQAEDDETQARELDARFNADLRTLLYDPEKGYYARRGKDAYEGVVPTLKAIDDLKKGYVDQGANRQQQMMLTRTLQARVDGVSDGIARHASVQRLAWIDTANQAVVADAKTSGATYFNDDKLRGQEYMRGRNSVIEGSQKAGEPEEVLVKKLRDYDSDFHSGVVRRYISTDDPNGAQRYYDANRKAFTGDDAIRLEKELKEGLSNRRAQQITNVVVATGGVSADYSARVQRAEGGAETTENKIGALGKYQMIPGTYTSLGQRTEWGKGKTQAEIRQMLLEPKEGGARQDELKKLYDQDSTKALQGARVPVNDLTLYTTHFLGHGAGPAILKLPDDTPLKPGMMAAHGGDAKFVEQVYGNNPFLAKVETVGDLKALLAQRIGAPAGLARTGSPEKPNLEAMLSAGIALSGGDLDLQDKVTARIKSEYTTKHALYTQQVAAIEKQAVAHIDAGGTLENMPAAVRGALDADSLTKVRAYEEKRLEKRRKEAGEEAERSLTDLERLGQLQPSDVEKVRNVLSGKEYRSWQKIAAGQDRIDDASTYERIQRGLGTRDMRDDIFNAHNAGEISNETRNALLQKNAEFLKEGAPASPYKLGHDYVVRSLDPGLMGAGISRQTAAAGIKEYDQYVANHPRREDEAPEAYAKRLDQFAIDTVKRRQLVSTQDMAVSLPVPAHAPFNRGDMTALPRTEATKRITAANAELSRRFTEGLITEDQYNADAVVLLNWLNFLQSRPEPTVTPSKK